MNAPSSERSRLSRRGLLVVGGAGVAGLAIGAGGTGAAEAGRQLTGGTPPAATPAAEIPPSEDLMREHGVLKRLLLVYDEAVRRLRAGRDVPPEAIANSADIVHTYIEGFHEGLEEAYVFPRLRRAGRLTKTVNTLLAQHAGGRRLTQRILTDATARGLADGPTRARLAVDLHRFVRMYAPHEAREDTVVFPAFRAVTPPAVFSRLGERFADEEDKRFGPHGLADMVARVAAIERQLGIYDLDQFTP